MCPLLLLLLAFFLRAATAAAGPAQASSCLHKACGDLNISYPFWLEEPGRPPCGPPSFQLKCNSSGAFLSHSVHQSYRVLSIFVENNSFHVVDDNLPLATGCPAPWFNISLGIGLAPFLISKANTELLFLANCTDPLPVVPPGFRPLPCDNHSFVWFRGKGEFVQGVIPPVCTFSVVPILADGSGDDFVASMKQGFLLEWTVVSGDCPDCVASGGDCMYDANGLGFSCNCSDGVRREKCGEFSKWKLWDEID